MSVNCDDCGGIFPNTLSYLLLDVGESEHAIPLPNVSSSVLKKVMTSPTWDQRGSLLLIYQVLEYCEHHRGEPLPAPDADQSQDETRKRTTDISEWDQKFITVDQEMLFEIILAANYLDIKSLLYVHFAVLLIEILTDSCRRCALVTSDARQ